ncbi:P-loop containing nucleoside triphosphate hydrolase protein [Sporormia fimetaria CBS 119925]|uniref:P-loop containing nucleoside triphosphate hydrolase protein n=1 Tax=Sporormia fimetaria CBS 119925 TaxID=1340428 RepID=A0A6A6VEH5_9PLEO|nr:P-loop containing nucleoside triphosphate hydrolase protein [Sporormia fimetaria CBS 119925]
MPDPSPTTSPTTPHTLLLGLSGPSCSGKTTLSRLLRDIIPHVSILHLDDFFLPDAQIPLRDGIQDWDCIDALNLPSLTSALAYIKTHSTLPPDLVSKEDLNEVGEHGVDEGVIEGWRARVGEMIHAYGRGGEEGKGREVRVFIVDGFLLFSEDMREVREMFDIKLFLRARYEFVKQRRENRKGYVTLEGFWEDPEGYVDDIVWPNYAADHAFLFRLGDVNGEIDTKVCERLGIRVMPGEGEMDTSVCLSWAMGVLYGEIKRVLDGKKSTSIM